ncbi:BamA/TamA family outer membrane protein [Paludibacteraceae bacterium OttesenSCG-928-F17]|nr:BamA/TamA family outer membrane protein [Paludibacteraceae bacterium OttesenSCG-928-F17]
MDKVKIETEKESVKKDDLNRYLRQRPNSSVFGVWRMQLRIHNIAGKDSTKRINRFFMRAGEAPVIYDSIQTYFSEQQLKKVMQNRGYMHASVNSSVEYNKKKAKVTYHIKEHDPYRVRNYYIDISNPELYKIVNDSANTLIKENILFDVDILNKERERITTAFRNQGYYKFYKDLIIFSADSALNANRVDVTIRLRELSENNNDSIYDQIFKKYYFRNIFFITSRNLGINSQKFNIDAISSQQKDNYYLINDEKVFLRMGTLQDNTFLFNGNPYNDRSVERTYGALNALSPVKFVNINFRETIEGDSLDCLISISRGKEVSLSAEIEATYTAGYFGIGTNLGLVHRNVFRGAESLSVQGRLAYEKQDDVFARELGLQTSLLFPNFLMPFTTQKFRRNIRANTAFNANVNFQDRPREFKVTSFGAGVRYGWNHYKFRHTLELLDLSFVDFDVTERFDTTFLTTGRFNRYNYSDHLITRIGYIGSFSTFNLNTPLKNYISIRYSIETAGNLPYAFNKIFGGKKNDDGFYSIFKIPYSQYVRGDFNISYHQIADDNNRFVYHFGLGFGQPYGNAVVIPYERRYFSGGANSVRGWAESTLGPGSYSRDPSLKSRRDYNQVGDIKLDLNAEYRFKMFRSLNGALFVDAGNVWTNERIEQEGLTDEQKAGHEKRQFKFNTFLNELAISYGIGLRLDISFVVIRLDLGVKLHDPTAKTRKDRWITKLSSDDFALHFAIGYPF